MASVADMLDNIVPISDFSRGKASQAFDRARSGNPVIVTKNNTPTAVILSPEEYKRMAEVEEDLYLLGLAIERLDANEGKAGIPFEEVLDHFGLTMEEIDAMDDVEFEHE